MYFIVNKDNIVNDSDREFMDYDNETDTYLLRIKKGEEYEEIDATYMDSFLNAVSYYSTSLDTWTDLYIIPAESVIGINKSWYFIY